MSQDFAPQDDPREAIYIRGARLHNLQGIDLRIPRQTLCVVTGLSGSGKSSLVFDTLYAEGQRRYVESLSSYARQFLGRMKKPEVDAIIGLSPAMAIEQKVISRNPRSTVGTSTEIYDYLKLLFARVGQTFSPVSNELVRKHQVSDVVDSALTHLQERVEVAAPFITHGRPLKEELPVLIQKGYVRLKHHNETVKIEELIEQNVSIDVDECLLLIDRLKIEDEEEVRHRLSDSIQTAFNEGHGTCFLLVGAQKFAFSNRFEADGIAFEEPNPNFFSFSTPHGACRTCEGFGSVIGIDEELVFPDKHLSIYDGAVAPWRGEKMQEWQQSLIKHGYKFDFPIHRSYAELSEAEKKLLWTGNEWFEGLNAFFKHLEEQAYKIQYRVMLSRYRGRTVCPDCQGTRLRKDAGYVKLVDAKTGQRISLQEIVLMPVNKLLPLLTNWKFDTMREAIADRLMEEVLSRLGFLQDVGLGYLNLNRLSNTLSGGESQRIKLATSLGSNLSGSMYILDEPSIGLHPRDNDRLVRILKNLRDKGNTVIVVEHEEAVIKAADYLVDIGPEAGSGGGKLVYSGELAGLKASEHSLTGAYLSGRMKIETPTVRRKAQHFLRLTGASEHNLKNLSVDIPLQMLTVVTGVSGSGKTTLIKRILYPALKRAMSGTADKAGSFQKLEGWKGRLEDVELIDQNPIGKSSRSNPATYTKAYDLIRNLFAEEPRAKASGLKAAAFSFNVEGGRCEVCQGEGIVRVEMQFLADVELECEACKGQRFKEDVLEVRWKGKNITEVLDLTIEDALTFFSEQKNILARLQPLADVGLGYIQLGQSSATLSGGEAQRIKLASYLTKGQSRQNMLFIFDEPTTGLHFHDINKLMIAFNALIDQGNSLLVIEHNHEVIQCADWVIDLGPEGGDEGGNIVFEGTPEALMDCESSYTGQYLATKMK